MTRGEMWLAALDPVRGSEQAGTRPLLILEADPLNAFLRTGLTSDSVVRCHQVRVSDKSRRRRRLRQVSDVTMATVDQAIRVTLGM